MTKGAWMTALAAPLLVWAQPALAGWKLVPANTSFANGEVTITPQSDWNLASGKLGKQTYAWTQDGFELNSLHVFAGVPAGQPLYKERDKKRNPLPKFDPSALLPDLVDLFERSFRAQNEVADFTVLEVRPASFGGQNGVRARFKYVLAGDDLVRFGEVRLAVKNSKLYAISFTAPALHYFNAGLPEAMAIMDSTRF